MTVNKTLNVALSDEEIDILRQAAEIMTQIASTLNDEDAEETANVLQDYADEQIFSICIEEVEGY